MTEQSRILGLPETSLVLLIGVSGSGKSTFAAEHFGPFETISADYCRGLVSNDVNSQAATKAAFEVLSYIASQRLEAGLLTVVDATNVQREARRSLIELARAHDVLPVAIVLDLPAAVCLARNASRQDRSFGAHVVRRQHDQLRRSLRGLAKEGLRVVHHLDSVEAVAGAVIERTRLVTNRRDDHGPFDLIGDVHGCRAELETLLDKLGYAIVRDDAGRAIDATHPDGRRVIFLGDLVDRGPDTVGVLRLAMGMTAHGHALAVPGNHEAGLTRALNGRGPAQPTHGLAETLAALQAEAPEFRDAVRQWCYDLVSHFVLDDGKLVVAHAGLKEAYQGRASGRVRSFALYGDATGQNDKYGFPILYPWTEDYRGSAMVIYGHTPAVTHGWVNNTLCLDTGCVFGGTLTAMRYPSKEIIAVPALQVWADSIRPLAGREPAAEAREPSVLDLADVMGKNIIETSHMGRLTIPAEAAAGALEVMSRFAIDPRLLLYLPPTMSPVATAAAEGYLEHPAEAFAYFRSQGVAAVMCQEKHMGSRAVLLVGATEAVARQRWGAEPGRCGAIYTRTGRPFFPRPLEEAALARVRDAFEQANLWQELATDWVLLDAEILPWSLKAGELIRRQYAPVGASGKALLDAAISALEAAEARGQDVSELLPWARDGRTDAAAFADVVRRYAWPTSGLDGVEVAPFQVLATEGAGNERYGAPHTWHMDIAERLATAAPGFIRPTRHLTVALDDPLAQTPAIAWWEDLCAAGGEGMVVKPWTSPTRGQRGLVQPGLKVRGQEYLRMTYGPGYLRPENLTRLRERSLGAKRSRALREYALGLEAIDRAVAGEPLWRIHAAVFAVLALESEPEDPRL